MFAGKINTLAVDLYLAKPVKHFVGKIKHLAVDLYLAKTVICLEGK
jgi:hypothetical protein